MKIKEINLLGIGVRKLGEMPMSGKLKFKIARNIKAIEDILNDAMQSSEDISNDDELLNTDVHIELVHFTEEELEPLEINGETMFLLLPIVDFEDN